MDKKAQYYTFNNIVCEVSRFYWKKQRRQQIDDHSHTYTCVRYRIPLYKYISNRKGEIQVYVREANISYVHIKTYLSISTYLNEISNICA